VISERNRLARELHDSVTQTLFSLNLTAAAAAALVERDPQGQGRDPAAAGADPQRHRGDALAGVRAAPAGAGVGRPGAGPAQARGDPAPRAPRRRAAGGLRPGPARPALERELLRVAQEALSNALRHARAATVQARLLKDVRPPDLVEAVRAVPRGER
jgi:signal transduction histidine kinase